MEVSDTVSDFDIKNPSTQDFLEQLLNQELQSPPPCLHVTDDYEYAGCQSQGVYCGPQENPRSFDCPSIEITSISHNIHVDAGSSLEVLAAGGAEGGYVEPPWHRNHLYLPLDACYREATLSPSPCSSLSSRSWVSDLSSCESFSHINDNVDEELHDAALLDLGSPGCGGGTFGVELWQQKYQHPLPFSPVLSPHQSPRQSPSHSPRTSITEDTLLNHRPTSRPSSRPTSPCGKRSHSGADLRARSPSPLHSASPTPGVSPRGSVTDDNRVGSPASTSGAYISGYQELDVPSKTRRTSGSHLGLLAGDPGPKSYLDSCGEEKREQGGIAELFLPVPFNFSWNKPKPENPPLFSSGASRWVLWSKDWILVAGGETENNSHARAPSLMQPLGVSGSTRCDWLASEREARAGRRVGTSPASG
ncbi:nuclear factor of activated T-cells, cytoplasmic 3-like [Nematolebias whitei]|uniref:nuclear factor of activated T-cells, cytoplasmic 3-like n=1 Tax=Nematolebias whitei TaxID=451745 RepID=UPI001898432C|nr:nuclear factor of activated T-cells, cytoplasmic 3-like [Nematolebias whitei]